MKTPGGWKLVYTKQARKDAKKLAASGLKPQAQRLLDLLTRRTPGEQQHIYKDTSQHGPENLADLRVEAQRQRRIC